MTSVVIAGYARSPFHFAKKGALIDVRPDDLAAQTVKALVQRSALDASLIEDLIMGCAYPEAEQGMNIARITSFLAGLPETVAGATVNRFCGSSMTSIHFAAGQIQLGAGDAFICAGVESMTRVPMGGFNLSPNPHLLAEFPQAYMPMGQTAEIVAERFGISRADQEAMAVDSHAKAARAREQGLLAAEIVPIDTPNGVVNEDGCIRPGTNLEALAQLKPAFGGSVTAGTASPLTDGAAAVLVCSEDFARAHGLDILARVKAVAVVGCPPEIMGMGPLYATRKLLDRAGLRMADIDLVEINEAFSSQALACLRGLELDIDRVNLHGGALAIGHPLGATGARITGKAAALLKETGGRYAIATQCIGGGQGVATLLEAVR
ncbi:thiolase family protein [Pseudomonas nitroreducens]|uniref:thiolase family protein n=1 Tax=Pseudomonas TaxID=286 RepID=UPI001473B716|nr:MULTISPECIES: thiolase family protein [Pseudomonas]MCJ1877745.1 thiolase family protein [Pseudomonas nitroreducens]MCJ1897107.1 thiolase family protein [Pseudomonas nitroreducens]MDG9857645.1 thiolase family protein [Pseudomonas nitroreducens]MDH1076762.1 thiolase family protein [Pseudomonas nitroreducens]NMZ73973.1 thiolase family protein [Pseudomonas nitroreducens]